MPTDFSEVVRVLGELAPLHLAEPWDNVGLLLEPSEFGSGGRAVSRILLTIDFSRQVFEEAKRKQSDLVVSYHPPIFSGIKRLTLGQPGTRLLLSALEAKMAIYSPHTALDAARGGMNDWLAEGAGAGKVTAIWPHQTKENRFKLVVWVPEPEAEALRSALCSYPGVAHIGEYSDCTFGVVGEGTFKGSSQTNPTIGKPNQLERVREVRLEMLCEEAILPRLEAILKRHHSYEEPAWEVHRLEPDRHSDLGMGREVTLDSPASIDELVERFRTHLGMKHLRVSKSERHLEGGFIERVQVCAGAGGKVFEASPLCDLYVTGELRHHQILDLKARGASVIVADHTNTERGYLPRLQKKLVERLLGMEVSIAESDRDPLEVV